MRIGMLLIVLAGLGVCCDAADTPKPAAADQQRREKPRERSERERGFGPAVWRAFSRLTEPERQELLKLQQNDPETFRQKMRELGDALRKEELKRLEELRNLVEKFQASKDEKERAELKTRIAKHIREHYMSRLEDSKRQLKEMELRTAKLKEELKKREANADAAIAVRVDAILSGEENLPDPSRERERDKHPLPPPPPPPLPEP